MKKFAWVLIAIMMLTFCAFAEETSENEWQNILFMGGDSRSTEEYERTDCMMIVSINEAEGEIKLTSIMRDTWVKIYGHGEGKINSANSAGGPTLVMRTVNEYFGMNISDYVIVGMSALADIIDEIGGVELTITEAEMNQINTQLTFDAAEFELNNADPLEVYGESIVLNGNQALAYARIRNIDSDYVRTERQRNVLIAIAKELQNEDIVTILSVVGTLMGYVDTNLAFSEVAELAGIGLQVDLGGLEQMRLPADGTYTSDTVDGVWSIRPNFEKNAALLYDFIYGVEEE